MFSGIKGKATEVATKVAGFGALAMAKATTLVYSDAFDEATKASTNLTNKLKTLAGSLLPLAIVISGVSMFFTRDQKKFDMEKKILIGSILAYALIVVATKGTVVTDTITQLFN